MRQYKLTDTEYAFLTELARDTHLPEYKGSHIAPSPAPGFIDLTTAHGDKGWITRVLRLSDGDVQRFLSEAKRLLKHSGHCVRRKANGFSVNGEIATARISGIRQRIVERIAA